MSSRPSHWQIHWQGAATCSRRASTSARRRDGVVASSHASGHGPAGAADAVWSVIVHGFATHARPVDRIVDGHRAEIAITIDELTGRAVLDTRGSRSRGCPA
jgi:hypothetical protein